MRRDRADLRGRVIDRTFANRKGKGTHRAIRVYERYRNRHAHVLRCDVFRYFSAIDHGMLKADFHRRIACERTLALIEMIIDYSNGQEPANFHYPGDDLFEPYRRRRGLPIGFTRVSSSPTSISMASITL